MVSRVGGDSDEDDSGDDRDGNPPVVTDDEVVPELAEATDESHAETASGSWTRRRLSTAARVKLIAVT